MTAATVNDAKRSKFLELGEQRVNRALKGIRLIGNLSNRTAYAYSDEDVTKIVKALDEAVAAMEAKFAPPTGKQESAGFSF